MTYDMHGAWESVTNHQSPIYANPADPSQTTPVDVKNRYNASDILKTFNQVYGVPKNKLNMGTPFYSRGWKGVQPGPNGNGLYQAATGAYTGSLDSPSAPGGQESWFNLKKLETTAGWTKYYDNTADAVWLYNQSSGVFLTYEDEKTLADKCNYVNNNAYGGIIIWEITGDSATNGFPMTSLVYNNLKGSINNTLQPATLSASAVTNGSFTLSAVVPAYNTATSYKFFEGTTQIASGTLTAGQSSSVTLTTAVSNKPAGTYNYTVQLTAGTSSVTSNQVTVTVPVAPTLKAATLSVGTVTNGSYTLTAVVPANDSATSYKFFEGTTQIATGTLTAGNANTVTLTKQITGKSAGTYSYTVTVYDAASNSLTSNSVSVTVTTPVNTLQAAALSAGAVTNGSYTLTAVVPSYNTATSYKFFEGTTQIATGTLTAGNTLAVNLTKQVTGKSAGTYSYTVVVYDAAAKSLTSNTVTVTVANQGYPAWAAGVSYKVGDIVSYNGVNYQCRQAHTSLTGWEPPATPALWLQI
jgi:chitinase